MKNAYRVILIGLAVLGVVYSSTGQEKKTEEGKHEAAEECLKSGTEPEEKSKKVWYKPVDLCKFAVSIDVGHYIQLKECNKRKIVLKQVDCSEISQANSKFPCYKGNDVIEVRANFPAIFNASLNKNDGGEDMLKEFRQPLIIHF